MYVCVKAFSSCCLYRAIDHLVTMSLLNCEDSCVSGQSESDCCAAMASACSAAAKDDSVSGTASTGTLSSSFMEEIQGYDVEFDPPLESKYECPICLMALREAVQTPCGHRFCKACIIKSIRYVTEERAVSHNRTKCRDQWTQNTAQPSE